MPPVAKFTVKRDTWARGAVPRDEEGRPERDMNSLLSNDGTQCCLGFLGTACGYSNMELIHEGLPHEMCEQIEKDCKWPSSLVKWFPEVGDAGGPSSTRLQESIVAVNDDEKISEVTRECRLHELFAQAGIQVEFV